MVGSDTRRLEGANASELSKPAWIRDSCQFGNPQLREARKAACRGQKGVRFYVRFQAALSVAKARETIAERRADDGIDEVGEDVAAFDIHFRGRGVRAASEIFSSRVGRYGGACAKILL